MSEASLRGSGPELGFVIAQTLEQRGDLLWARLVGRPAQQQLERLRGQLRALLGVGLEQTAAQQLELGRRSLRRRVKCELGSSSVEDAQISWSSSIGRAFASEPSRPELCPTQ